MNNQKTAVVLLNLGGPDSLKAVQPFLYNLFRDPDIIDFPLSFLFRNKLARMISTKRTPRIQEQYGSIGGKSPILEFTVTQAKLLQQRLALHTNTNVYVAMRYSNPFTEEVLDKIERENIQKVLLLPLYPHYSRATTGSSVNEWKRQIGKRKLNHVETVTVEEYHLHPSYINSVAERIKEGLQRFPEEKRENVHILFSAHGTPLKLVKEGDPYSSQIRETVGAVIKAGSFSQSYGLSFQSKVGPLKWLTPSTHETIVELGQNFVKNLLVVPIAFVSDHLETLYEINIEYRRLAACNGIEKFEMTQGLNDSPVFIDALEKIVMGNLNLS